MSVPEPPVALVNALHHLADEARRAAAIVPMSSSEHAFYNGVETAAEDRLRPVRQEAHDSAWLAAQSPSFREGYMKTMDMVAAQGHAPLHLRLPEPT